jgi:putative peptidoglycan lipid II flippase
MTGSLARARLGPLLNTFIVAGGYMLSRMLGLGREVIISAQFGTRAELDAYRATFGVLDLIYLVIAGGALGSAFIPIFTGFLTEEREQDAWRLASDILNMMLVALLVACALIALLAEPLVAWTIGSGFDEPKRALTVHILRLLLIQPVLLGMAGLAKATLESFDRFTLPVVGANVYNLGIIGGAALFLLVQLPGLRGIGARYTPTLRLNTPGVRQVGWLIGPRLFGQAVWQINLIAIASFASLVGNGAVAANGYALQLMLLPHGLIALSLGTVIFPQLARSYAAGDQSEVRRIALGATRQVLFLALPASMIFGILGMPIVRALFERGQFTAESTAMTSEALIFYAFGLAAFAAAEILVRTFYATRDTRTPVLVGVAAVAANVALGWALINLGAGLNGLAIAFSTANTIEVALLLMLLGRRLGGIGGGFWRAAGRMSLAALCCGAVLLALRLASAGALPFLTPSGAYNWRSDFLPLLLWLAGAAGLSLLTYGAIATLLGVEEMRVAWDRTRRLAARMRGK